MTSQNCLRSVDRVFQRSNCTEGYVAEVHARPICRCFIKFPLNLLIVAFHISFLAVIRTE